MENQDLEVVQYDSFKSVHKFLFKSTYGKPSSASSHSRLGQKELKTFQKIIQGGNQKAAVSQIKKAQILSANNLASIPERGSSAVSMSRVISQPQTFQRPIV
jgi:hypothetical protein